MPSVRSRPQAQAQATAAELRSLVGRLKRRLREQSSLEGLTLSQISVLSHLEREGPATVTALAQREHVKPQSMGATVASLLALDLVNGAPDPADGRRTVLKLTPLARDTIQSMRVAREDWLYRAIREQFNDEEQDALARGVALLKRLAES